MRHTVAAEAIRLTSTKIWLWAAVAAALCGGGLVGMVVGIGPANVDPPMPALDTAQGVSTILGIASVTLFVPAIVGMVAMTGEYRHRSITTTFLFTPVRWKVLVAKLIVFAGAGIAYGIVLAVTATVALYGGAALHGTTVGLPAGDIAAFMFRLITTACAYTLIGVGIGGLVRNQLAALGIVIGYFYFVELLLLFIPGVNLAYPYLVGGATSALLGFSYLTESVATQVGTQTVHLLTPIGGGLVLFGYAALAAVIAVLLPLRQDVH